MGVTLRPHHGTRLGCNGIPVYHAAYLTVLVRAMCPWNCLAPAVELLAGVAVVAQVQPFAYPLSVVDYQAG